MPLPATEEDVFGLFDDLLQQTLVLLQVGDFRLIVGHRTGQAQPLVAERGAGRMRHDHRAQLLLVELKRETGYDCKYRKHLFTFGWVRRKQAKAVCRLTSLII